MSSTTPEEDAETHVYKRPRASLACLQCRKRKVRCDFSRNGHPCMNCRLDDQTCDIKTTRRRKPWKIRVYPVCEKGETEVNPQKTRTAPQAITTETQISLQTPAQSADWITHNEKEQYISHKDNLWDENWLTKLDRTLGEADNAFTDDISTTSTDQISKHPTGSHKMMLYCTYPFVARANVFYTPVQDIQFLDAEGCFQLPVPVILDQFLRQYFMQVHPLLPMLSESDFWEAYSRPRCPESKAISLFLVQAMLFASCSFVPLSAINSLGYTSTRSARAAFYRKAKIIYDSGIESSAVPTAQAALLLTFWTPPREAELKPNTTWLMIAIEAAKRAQADRYSSVGSRSSTYTDEKHSKLKRLWWCCIISDRILPLGLRRSIQITPAHFDLHENMMEGIMELQSEVRHSELYCQDTKEGLAATIQEMVKLCIVLTDVLLLVYPLKSTSNQSGEAAYRVQQCKKSLSEWLHQTPFFDTNEGTASMNRQVLLNITLMEAYYHWAIISLCYFDLRTARARELDVNLLNDTLYARKEAEASTVGIVDSIDRLNRMDLTRCLPISVVAYAAFPLAIHIIELTRDNEQGMVNEQRLGTLIRAMKILHEQYDGVDEVIKTVRHIVDYARSYLSQTTTETNCTYRNDLQNPDLALRVSLAMDWSLSSGRSSDGDEFTSYLRALFCQPQSVDLPESPEQIVHGDNKNTTEHGKDMPALTESHFLTLEGTATQPSLAFENFERAELEDFFSSGSYDDNLVAGIPGMSFFQDVDYGTPIHEHLMDSEEVFFNNNIPEQIGNVQSPYFG